MQSHYSKTLINSVSDSEAPIIQNVSIELDKHFIYFELFFCIS
ncbi:hypothetical protein M067_3549 [Bacteroides fragilis str. J-143-4]|nr:hypothetical protein M067_3549 [Bacteroides fragilis str. J-143-4]